MFKLLFLLLLLYSSNILGSEKKIIIASTTSTYDTGLLSFINNKFKEKFDIEVKVLAQGTGQALRTAKDGNIEILIVHHTLSELDFMKNGYGYIRYNLMFNDFILVGPRNDNLNCINLEEKLYFIFSQKLKFI